MLIALSGPSGIGKGFIKERLLMQYPQMEEIPWVTTRSLRPGETRNNRICVESHEFDHMLESGELVLVQELYGNRYGMTKRDAVPNDRLRITEFHPGNIESALHINPNIILVGLLTTDAELLSKRMQSREDSRKSSSAATQRSIAALDEIATMTRLAHLYTAIIEVEKETETQVFDRVLEILNPLILKGGSDA